MNAARADLALTTNRQSAYVIVRPADAIPAEVRAANELQRFIGEVSGVTLPIRDDSQPLPERAIVLGNVRGLPLAVEFARAGYRVDALIEELKSAETAPTAAAPIPKATPATTRRRPASGKGKEKR